MALPVVGTRGDIIVLVEFDPVGAAGIFTNACGVTNASFQINNEVINFKVGDCDDWSLAVQTVKNYGALDASLSIDSTWTLDTDKEMLAWALEQKTLNVRLSYPNAANTGQVSRVDFSALLETYSIDGIGNVDGNPQTQTLNLQLSGEITPTYVP